MKSMAERYRAHRAEMELALQLGCTPRESRCELERRAARDRWCEVKARLDCKTTDSRAPTNGPDAQPWMMRD